MCNIFRITKMFLSLLCFETDDEIAVYMDVPERLAVNIQIYICLHYQMDCFRQYVQKFLIYMKHCFLIWTMV